MNLVYPLMGSSMEKEFIMNALVVKAEITDGNYFVKFIDTNTIKLADSRSALEKESFTNVTGISAGSSHKLTPTDLHGLKLINQSNFKRILQGSKTS